MMSPRAQETRHGADFTVNVMHVDTDAICPKCMNWISPTDIVRRTAYGLVQHEACALAEPLDVDEFSSR
jgi:hypothetical protein